MSDYMAKCAVCGHLEVGNLFCGEWVCVECQDTDWFADAYSAHEDYEPGTTLGEQAGIETERETTTPVEHSQ